MNRRFFLKRTIGMAAGAALAPLLPAKPASKDIYVLLTGRQCAKSTSLAAIDAVNSFTRTKMREDGFYRRILPPQPIVVPLVEQPVGVEHAFHSLQTRVHQ